MALTANLAAKAKPQISSTAVKLTASKHIKQAGYTLVEVMAVMVIIGLMTSAVVLTMPQDKAVVNAYAEDLVRDLNGAAQSSLLTGKMAALGVSEKAYAIYAYEDEAWVPKRTGDWPEGVFVTFEKDETKLKLTEEIIPLAVFEPTGQSTLFKLTLRNHDKELRLSSNGDGHVVLGDIQ